MQPRVKIYCSKLLYGYGAVKELSESSHFSLVVVFFGLKHFSFVSPKIPRSVRWDFRLKPCTFPALGRHSETSLRAWWDLLWNLQGAQVEIFCTCFSGEISHSLTLVSHRSHSCLGEMNETLLRSLFQFSFPLGSQVKFGCPTKQQNTFPTRCFYKCNGESANCTPHC